MAGGHQERRHDSGHGGNPAETTLRFKWAIEAKRNRNAKMIVVDPRYTRTAAVADMHVQIRAGSDLALLGGFINYILENGRVNRQYLAHFTNAAFIVKEASTCPKMACTPASTPKSTATTRARGTTKRAVT